MKKLIVRGISFFIGKTKVFHVDDSTLDLDIWYSNNYGVVNTDYVYQYVDRLYQTCPSLNLNLTIEELE